MNCAEGKLNFLTCIAPTESKKQYKGCNYSTSPAYFQSNGQTKPDPRWQ